MIIADTRFAVRVPYCCERLWRVRAGVETITRIDVARAILLISAGPAMATTYVAAVAAVAAALSSFLPISISTFTCIYHLLSMQVCIVCSTDTATRIDHLNSLENSAKADLRTSSAVVQIIIC